MTKCRCNCGCPVIFPGSCKGHNFPEIMVSQYYHLLLQYLFPTSSFSLHPLKFVWTPKNIHDLADLCWGSSHISSLLKALCTKSWTSLWVIQPAGKMLLHFCFHAPISPLMWQPNLPLTRCQPLLPFDADTQSFSLFSLHLPQHYVYSGCGFGILELLRKTFFLLFKNNLKYFFIV